jgi:predicted RNA-binding Zn-ribbon protein involved in translation (DUF1610 family)
MSLERTLSVPCPECGHEQPMRIWETITAQISPEAREDLLEGRLHRFECAKCGEIALLAAPLLYHDLERRFLAQYMPFEAIDDEFLRQFNHEGEERFALGGFEGAPLDANDPRTAYFSRPHFVFDLDELVRYVQFREALHAFHEREDKEGTGDEPAG